MRTQAKTLAQKPLEILMFRMIQAAVLMGLLLLCAARANADIIKLQGTQSCQVIGLDTSAAGSHGGVHCNTGNTGFSLTQILSGGLPLFVGNSQTPSWNVVNDTGATITSLTLYFSGTLASNANIDMQVGGGSPFTACTEINGSNVTFTDPNCGSHDVAPYPEILPLQFTWSGGSVAAGGTFNIATASFAHSGQDAGCISGTANCSVATPEPSSISLLATGMGSGLAAFNGLIGNFRRKRRA